MGNDEETSEDLSELEEDEMPQTPDEDEGTELM